MYVLTVSGGGGSSRVAPLTPDSRFPGAKDPHRVAPHLDKIDCSGLEARQPTGRQISNIIHHLRGNLTVKRRVKSLNAT